MSTSHLGCQETDTVKDQGLSAFSASSHSLIQGRQILLSIVQEGLFIMVPLAIYLWCTLAHPVWRQHSVVSFSGTPTSE